MDINKFVSACLAIWCYSSVAVLIPCVFDAVNSENAVMTIIMGFLTGANIYGAIYNTKESFKEK